MLTSIVLVVLSLNFGATCGFKPASFLVPFLLAWPLFALFFVWEARPPEGHAVLPPLCLGWWVCIFGPFIETYRDVHGESNIMAVTRMLPEGIATGTVCLVMA
jgi:hypothetical protein